MSSLSPHFTTLPPEQEAIRAKCFHPAGAFEEFLPEDLEGSIPERFEKIVRKYPDRIAVKTRSHEVSYDGLNRAANRLARVILAKTGQDPKPVALFLEHGVPPIIANLGILKAGKVAVQTDPAAERSRIAHLLADSQAALVITNTKNYSMARERMNAKHSLINMDELDSSLSDVNPKLSIPSNAPASVRYTTGSTGQAKGSVKTHRHELHAVANLTKYFRICADDRVIMLGRHVLGKHTFEALLNGGTLYPFDLREEDLVTLGRWLIQQEITIYKSFPTAFRHFVDTLSGHESFPKLRLIRLEGEPVYSADLELYKKHFASNCLFVNSFSSTETGTVCVYFADKNTQIDGHRIPVGYPVDGMEVLLLDELGRDVGPNQLGEIAVRSRFLSAGYWQKPELTREKFHLEPGTEKEQLYLTGDLGEMSEHGCMVLLGRKDFEIKIRGSRVDVSQTEAALAEHPGIKELTVVPKKLPSGDTRLVAYLVARQSPAPAATDLRHFLKQRLPEFMIPTAFVVLDKLPLLATGKVDRRELPDPGDRRPELDTPYVSPRTGIESELRRIWTEVLGISRIGIHDSFFDLGGHSLAATRVVSQVIKQFQLELPLQSLFESTTVATMAAVITEHQGKKVGEKELDRILTELESLTDEEARRLLADKSATVQRSD
jgi:non-ribosomal peptide synthetase component F/acyl carrier protein